MKSSKGSSKSTGGPKVSGNFSETGKNLVREVGKTFTSELSSMGSDAFDTLMGKTPGVGNRQSGTGIGDVMPRSPFEQSPYMPMGPEMMQAMGRKKEKPRDINVFSFQERQEMLHVKETVKDLIKTIRAEMAEIEKQNKTLIAESKRLSAEQMPEHVGIYHINFLEFILRTLRDIRKKVTEAANWAGVARGKQKKMGYWGMAKKKGTSFTLSGERTSATQTG